MMYLFSISGHLGKLLSCLLFFAKVLSLLAYFVAIKDVLSQQTHVYHNKIMLIVPKLLSWQFFIMTNMSTNIILSRLCRDFCLFVTTSIILWQFFWGGGCDKTFLRHDPCGSSRQWYYSSEICCKLVPLVCFSFCTLCVFQWSSASAGLAAADGHKESGHSCGLEGECVV